MSVEHVLSYLDRVRRTGSGWSARCPAHEDKHPSLSVAEGDDGRVLLHCFAGCSYDSIRAALSSHGLDESALVPDREGVAHHSLIHATVQHPVSSGLTIEAYADAKKLPINFLKSLGLRQIYVHGSPVIAMPYFDDAGSEVAVRHRLALDGPGRFRWRKGDRPLPYGLWRHADTRAADPLLLLEGESCAQTAWLHGLPALGLPGASTLPVDTIDSCIASTGSETVYAIMEADSGGEALMRVLSQSAYRGRIRVVRLAPFGDLSELYVDDPDAFIERLEAAIVAAEPITSIIGTVDATAVEEARSACASLAAAPRILDRLADELVACGVVGEERIAKVLFLALTSRLLPRPVSVAVKGPSSGGKSFVLESVLKFFPQTAYFALTSMSEKALVYSDEPLSHRFLVLFEAAGMLDGFQTYAIRSLLSEGRLRYETVEKTADGMRPRLIERDGPTGLIVTTTLSVLHAENETRMITLTVNDSPEQTRRVLLAMSLRTPEPDVSMWHALQAWIEAQSTAVDIPFAATLAAAIPPVAVRLRRDLNALLRLIETHALLHQVNRSRDAEGRVVASLEDYEVVRTLVADLFSTGVEASVKPQVRSVVDAVARLRRSHPDGVSLPMLVAETGRDKSTVSRHAKEARGLGFLDNLETRRGVRARYTTADPLPDDVEILPKVDDLADRCGVARDPKALDGHVPHGRVPEECILDEIAVLVDNGVLIDITEMHTDEQVMCRYPAHRPTDWQTASGRLVCGTCHPHAEPQS